MSFYVCADSWLALRRWALRPLNVPARTAPLKLANDSARPRDMPRFAMSTTWRVYRRVTVWAILTYRPPKNVTVKPFSCKGFRGHFWQTLGGLRRSFQRRADQLAHRHQKIASSAYGE